MKVLSFKNKLAVLVAGSALLLLSNGLKAEEKTSANSSPKDASLSRCMEALNKARQVVRGSKEASKEQKADESAPKKDSAEGHAADKK